MILYYYYTIIICIGIIPIYRYCMVNSHFYPLCGLGIFQTEFWYNFILILVPMAKRKDGSKS